MTTSGPGSGATIGVAAGVATGVATEVASALAPEAPTDADSAAAAPAAAASAADLGRTVIPATVGPGAVARTTPGAIRASGAMSSIHSVTAAPYPDASRRASRHDTPASP